MNKTQKKILGWALIAIGVLMVAGAVISNLDVPGGWDREVSDSLSSILKSPLLYMGLIFAVAGMVVLAGDAKDSESTGKSKHDRQQNESIEKQRQEASKGGQQKHAQISSLETGQRVLKEINEKLKRGGE